MSPKPAPKPSTLEPVKAPRRPHPMAIMADHSTDVSVPTVAAPTVTEDPEVTPAQRQDPPAAKKVQPAADTKPAETATQRLTVDIPVGVARRIKALASMRGEKLNVTVATALQSHLNAADEAI